MFPKAVPTVGEGRVRLPQVLPTVGQGRGSLPQVPPTVGQGRWRLPQVPPTVGEGRGRLLQVPPTRECEVLRWIIHAKTDPEIAGILEIRTPLPLRMSTTSSPR